MKMVVMTGGTAGLGKAAAQQIFETPNTRLLLGARARGTGSPGVETLPLDLASLQNVRAFARLLREQLGDMPIDALVLNAGTQFTNLNQRTEDGFETTFAVNHLAHYLLLRLLVPRLAQGATVVITTSETHDPKVNPLAPKQVDLEEWAHPKRGQPAGFISGFRAYSASKLCNLLTAGALAASEEAKARQLTVIAYNPGLTPDTSLFRAWPPWGRALIGLAILIRPIARTATSEQAGQELADLALGHSRAPSGRIYASLVSRRLMWPDPAPLAQRDDAMKNLWRDSARMVGLNEQPD